MTPFNAYRELCDKPGYKAGDTLVVFGEIFQRGYVNGIIEEAEKAGMNIIAGTVGRREKDGTLRPLNSEELSEKHYKIINVPLEAGFDLEPDSHGNSPVDRLQGVKMSAWKDVAFDWNSVEESMTAGVKRFRAATREFLSELDRHIAPGSNVLFVHTMAGGFPRAKVVMPIANKVFKGAGERYCSSEEFWNSEIGKLCQKNFNEVTGETFKHLIEESESFRKKVSSNGGQCSYVAYGFHGTEILLGDDYKWQSYSPYLQGWAKLRLEEIAKEKFSEGVKASVYNAPEILTNSSSIFLGVEVPLYCLLAALRKEAGDRPETDQLFAKCQALLKDEHSFDEIMKLTTEYFSSDVIKKWSQFAQWPQHNGPEQMQMMRDLSTKLIDMHKDSKQLMTATLSEVVFKSCGKVMFYESWSPRETVWWIGHDIVAKVAFS